MKCWGSSSTTPTAARLFLSVPPSVFLSALFLPLLSVPRLRYRCWRIGVLARRRSTLVGGGGGSFGGGGGGDGGDDCCGGSVVAVVLNSRC